MAMLAEKKRRQKWCLNPRGNSWSADQTKFGQRLLEKMGWSSGQGLGINNQGPTEIVKVKQKDDSKGLGFKETGEEWLKTTSDYSELLDQLGSIDKNVMDQVDVTSSLEDRSKKSKARVHYHKFTRGKDLSRYSEKDLASIVGPELVKSNSSGTINVDYTINQINKGSSQKYFDSKKNDKHYHVHETTTNEDKINQEEQIRKKHKKSKKYKIEDSHIDVEQKREPNELSKKSKKHKHTSENVNSAHCDGENESNKDSIKKKKNKENSISCIEDEDKEYNNEEKKKEKMQQNIQDIDSIENLDNVENEVFKNKIKKKKRKTDNEDQSDSAKQLIKKIKVTEDNINNVIYENLDSLSIPDLNAVPASEEQTSKDKKLRNKSKKTRMLEIQKVTDFEEDNINNDIDEKLNSLSIPDLNTATAYEEPTSKHKKLRNKSKKTRMLAVQKITDFEEGEEDNINNDIDEKLSSLSIPDLNTVSVSEEQTSKPKKLRNKPKKTNMLELQKITDFDGPEEDFANSKKKEEKLIKNKYEENKSSINDNEISTSKTSSECFTVFGPKTRLKNLNLRSNVPKHTKFETAEYMSFNESTSKSLVQEDNWNCENYLYKKIYVEPNNYDANISMNVANYEYRLLSRKLKLLNITTGEIKVVIRDSASLPKKLLKKLKLLNKSNYYKSFLPAHELADVEVSVEKFSAELQPNIDLINELLKKENETEDSCGRLIDTNTHQIAQGKNKTKLPPIKKETLNGLKKHNSNNIEESAGKNSTKRESPDSKCDNNKEGVSLLQGDNTQSNSLQTRFEEKLKVLAEQMKQLTESRKLSGENNTGVVQSKLLSISRGRGSRKQWTDTTHSSNNNYIKYKQVVDERNCSKVTSLDPAYTRSGRGASFNGYAIQSSWGRGYGLGSSAVKSHMTGRGTSCNGYAIQSSWGRGYGLGQSAVKSHITGRGVRTVIRGRISKNNFDAKQYAKKCKVNNVLPEIAFKGVDLKIISGYADNSNEQSDIKSSATVDTL